MAEYINRAELIENLNKFAPEHYNALINQLITKQPTADVVEVKYGYWEIVKGSNGKEKMVCTNCRHQQDLHSTFTYCPNCGALIDGRVIHNG